MNVYYCMIAHVGVFRLKLSIIYIVDAYEAGYLGNGTWSNWRLELSI